MNAQDVMTQYVTSVGPEDPLSKAVRIMLQNEISGRPSRITRTPSPASVSTMARRSFSASRSFSLPRAN